MSKVHQFVNQIRVHGLALGFSAAFALLGPAASADPLAAPTPGIYTGTIKTYKGIETNMSLEIRNSNLDLPSNDPDDPVHFKKQILGFFTIEDEAGPFSLGYTNFDYATGVFDLYYVRSSQSGSSGGSVSGGAGSSGPSVGNGSGNASGGQSTPSVYALWFSGKIAKGNVFKGTVKSGMRGDLGTFSLKLDPSKSVLTTYGHIAIGTFRGDYVYPTNTQPPESVVLSIGAAPTDSVISVVANPPTMELDYTPEHTASLNLRNLLIIPFTQVYIDYFTRTISLQSNFSSGGQVRVSASYATPDHMVGTGFSPGNLTPAKFDLKRVGDQ